MSPSNSREERWLQRVEEFRRDNPKHPPGGIVFVGDAITFEIPFKELFPNQPYINRGIKGDRIEGVARRLEESIWDLHPSKVFMMIGVNELFFPDELSSEAYEREYQNLFSRLSERGNDCRIYILSILPIFGPMTDSNPLLVEANAIQHRLAQEHSFHYIDLHSHFRTDTGELKPEFSQEGIHLNLEGYRLWKQLLQPYLDE